MKIVKRIALAAGLLLSLQSFAEIRETATMADVAKAITPGTLVVFDLDNTVLEASQTLGTDQFFSYLVARGKAAGLNAQDAKNLALELSTPIQPVTSVRLVENLTRDLVQALQENDYTTIALTARPGAWADGTLHQVESLGINFSITAPRISRNDLSDSSGGLYRDGVIFLAPGYEKGPTLMKFIERAGLKPEKIVFIDDKKSNVESVDAALTAAGIPNIEFRYGAADRRVANFSSEIAEFQYDYFMQYHTFISDADAEQLIFAARMRDALAPDRE
jgi:phosphoserine phosphatase